jgi:pimeloyl-ACP methyl ester carboxylesterase
MATFVLVHGAWCWSKVVPGLEGLGHRAVAIDLPGLGEDTTPVAEVTFDGTIDRVVAAVEKEAEPVVLVGHSLGGVSISATAERIPDRVRLLIYLSAFLPRDGDSVNAIYEAPDWPQETAAPPPIRSADGLSISHTAEGARQRFFQDCSDADAAYAVARLKPQPLVMRTTPVQITPERFGRVPRAYIHCLNDNAAPLARQRKMVALSPCQQVAELPTGHSPFFAAPDLLVRTLADMVSRVRPAVARGGERKDLA